MNNPSDDRAMFVGLGPTGMVPTTVLEFTSITLMASTPPSETYAVEPSNENVTNLGKEPTDIVAEMVFKLMSITLMLPLNVSNTYPIDPSCDRVIFPGYITTVKVVMVCLDPRSIIEIVPLP